jgi:hypothetical protein
VPAVPAPSWSLGTELLLGTERFFGDKVAVLR